MNEFIRFPQTDYERALHRLSIKWDLPELRHDMKEVDRYFSRCRKCGIMIIDLAYPANNYNCSRPNKGDGTPYLTHFKNAIQRLITTSQKLLVR